MKLLKLNERDYKWLIFILVIIIGVVLTWRLNDNDSVVNIISMFSSGASISLAIIAIIYSISESVKNDNKESELNKIVYKVEDGVTETNSILQKMNVNNDDMQVILSKMSNQFEQLQESVDIVKEAYGQSAERIKSDEEIDTLTKLKDNIKVENEPLSDDDSKALTNLDSIIEKDNNEEVGDNSEASKNIICRRGDVFYADLSPFFGSEQGGSRPVIIIQNDIGNRYSPTVTIMPLTTKIMKGKLPTHVEISSEELMMDKNFVALAEQIRTLDKRRLYEKSGTLNKNTMKKIDKAISIQLNLN
jgi:Growth inhibitor